MRIIKITEKSILERRDIEILGIDKMPSNILSRQNQTFFDYYTRQKFTGKSKYDLNREVYKLAQRKDEIGTLAQFCLQIERESIVTDEDILKSVKNQKSS